MSLPPHVETNDDILGQLNFNQVAWEPLERQFRSIICFGQASRLLKAFKIGDCVRTIRNDLTLEQFVQGDTFCGNEGMKWAFREKRAAMGKCSGRMIEIVQEFPRNRLLAHLNASAAVLCSPFVETDKLCT